MATASLDELDVAAVYRNLNAEPELGFEEHRTAEVVARHLTAAGFSVTTGIGGTGVVGTLDRPPPADDSAAAIEQAEPVSSGPVVMLRADMDALPVTEMTGLEYASTTVATRADGTSTSVMHACGHDVHTSCLIGAAYALAADSQWSGRVIAVFQPVEELGRGARGMVADGLFAFPAVVNDATACNNVQDAFADLPGVTVVDPGVVTGSEDVGILAIEAGAPCAYWLLGGSNPQKFVGANSVAEIAAIVTTLPSNHSPFFAPVPDPTLHVGVSALVAAARHWLH